MINKLEFKNFINKYHLNKLVESVKWEIKDNTLNIKFTSPSKEMIGEITLNNFNLIDSTIGINNTDQLLKLIEITNGDLMLDFIKSNKFFTKLIISDNKFTVNYSLSDIITIPKSGKYSGPEEYDLEIHLDQDNILDIIKAKSALSESNTVLIKNNKGIDNDQLELIFGGDIEYSNKVSYYLPTKTTLPEFEICFNSDIIKEIFYSNKDSIESKIYLNLEGLIKFEFKTETSKCVYYLVKKNNN